MKSFGSALLLLLVLAGCQNSQAPNPFAGYGPTRLPPPGTQSYGQPAQTAPYYQGPSDPNAPSLPSNYTPPGQQPAQFSPPPGSYPANQGPASSYQQGQWRGVSQSTSSGDVVPANFTEEISTTSQANGSQSNGSPQNGSQLNGSQSTGSQTSQNDTAATADGSSSGLRGMRVNEVTEPMPALSPPPTATAPSSGWTSMATQTAPAYGPGPNPGAQPNYSSGSNGVGSYGAAPNYGVSSQPTAPPQPSRIP